MSRCQCCGKYAKPCVCGAVPAEATPDLFDPKRLRRISKNIADLFSFKDAVSDFIDGECKGEVVA